MTSFSFQFSRWVRKLVVLLALSSALTVALTAPVPSASAHALVTDLRVENASPVGVAGSSPTLKQLALASDGTGGLVYLASSGGVQHVYVARITRGVYTAPVQLDNGLPGASSEPSIAAGPGGELVVAFVNSGSVYTSSAAASTSALSAPTVLASSADSPSVSLNVYGQGYIVFTKILATASDDIEAYYWDGAAWNATSEWVNGMGGYESMSQCATSTPQPLNLTAADAAGSGDSITINGQSTALDGDPVVFTSHDGEGFAAWGEAGHIYSTRLWDSCFGGQTSSGTTAYDPPRDDTLTSYTPAGSSTALSEVDASDPQVSGDGQSTWENVSYDETFASGSTTEQGVVFTTDNEIPSGDSYLTITPTLLDGLNITGSANAGDPLIATNELDSGVAVSLASSTGSVDGNLLQEAQPGWPDGGPTATQPLGTLYSASAAASATLSGGSGASGGNPVAATGAGNDSSMVAWFGAASATDGTPTVIERYAPSLAGFNSAVTISNSASGAITPAAGLLAGSDATGDGVLAWVQNSQLQLGAAIVAPGAPALSTPGKLTTRSIPTLSWGAATEDFGAVSYQLTLDSKLIGTTTARSWKLPGPLHAGTHSWTVLATNSAGQTASASGSFTVTKYVVPKAAAKTKTKATGKSKAKSTGKAKSKSRSTGKATHKAKSKAKSASKAKASAKAKSTAAGSKAARARRRARSKH